jgi:hypothetical protein
MWVTSTWSLVGTHPESNLGPHNDRWMVTYPRGPLGLTPIVVLAKVTLPKLGVRCSVPFDGPLSARA